MLRRHSNSLPDPVRDLEAQNRVRPRFELPEDPAITERRRIEEEYARRAANPNLQQIYSPIHPDSLLAIHTREHSLMRLLRKFGFSNLGALKLLDIGCGNGDSLLRWLSYGFKPENCVGIDLLLPRIERARTRLPATVTLLHEDAAQLPFPDASFDLITQFTVFSSILSTDIKTKVAREMLRVLQPEGMILWYDFWVNPHNPQTRGIRPKEIRNLFPQCACYFERTTLAPPVARRLASVSSFACECLERLKIFNSHFVVGIRRQVEQAAT